MKAAGPGISITLKTQPVHMAREEFSNLRLERERRTETLMISFVREL